MELRLEARWPASGAPAVHHHITLPPLTLSIHVVGPVADGQWCVWVFFCFWNEISSLTSSLYWHSRESNLLNRVLSVTKQHPGTFDSTEKKVGSCVLEEKQKERILLWSLLFKVRKYWEIVIERGLTLAPGRNILDCKWNLPFNQTSRNP